MKIVCDVLNGKCSKELSSAREVLISFKTVQLGDQDSILRGLSSYYVVSLTSLFNTLN